MLLNVPALLCEQCGDEFIDIGAVKDIEIILSKVEHDGMRMGFVEYQKPHKIRLIAGNILKKGEYRPVAMSIMASDGVKQGEAVECVRSQKAIQSIVFGASSRQHIIDTKELIERYS